MGKDLGMPDGVLINGKGPYQYNASVPDGINYETISVDPGNDKAVLILYVTLQALYFKFKVIVPSSISMSQQKLVSDNISVC